MSTLPQPTQHSQSFASSTLAQPPAGLFGPLSQPSSLTLPPTTLSRATSNPGLAAAGTTPTTRKSQLVAKTTSATTNVASCTKSPSQWYSRWQMFKIRVANISIWEKQSHRGQTTNAQAPRGPNYGQGVLPSYAPDWISGWLHPASLILFIIISVGASAGLTSLIAKSHLHQGIADVGNDTSSRVVAGIPVGKSLLWTFVPTLLLQIYSLCFTGIASALKERQPYIELQEAGDEGVTADKSILLDYAKQTEAVTVPSALFRGHILISTACFFSLILSLVATPAASHILIVSGNVQMSQSTSLTQRVLYNESGIDPNTNLASTIDYVSGIQFHNASRPVWTKDDYSFPPLDVPAAASAIGTNISTIVDASRLLPECRALNDGTEWTVQIESAKQWRVFMDDGTCNVTNFFPYNGNYEYFSQTYVQQNCSLDMGSSPSRILLFFAQLDQEKNFVSRALISCTTEYANTTGRLTMSFTPSPVIVSFENQSDHKSYPRPIFWQIFERNLAYVSTNDDAVNYSTTDLGRLVLDYTQAQSKVPMNLTADMMSPEPSALAAGLQKMLALAYAVAAESYLYSRIPNEADKIPLQATYSIYISRLVVVDAIAGSLLGIFILTTISAFVILLHTLSHTSILKEEPRGLLGSAILTYNSTGIDQVSSDLRNRCPDGKCIKEYDRKADVKQYGENKYRGWRWKAENTNSATGFRIVAVQQAQPPNP